MDPAVDDSSLEYDTPKMLFGPFLFHDMHKLTNKQSKAPR